MRAQKIFITGDTHGDYYRIKRFCKKHETSKEDVLIILGDAGYNYFLGERDYQTKKRITKLPITLFCIRGNHEARPQNLSTMKEDIFFDNKVYYEEDYPNIKYAVDGFDYYIPYQWYFDTDECKFKPAKSIHTMVIGGAYSVDKYHRINMGWSWFEDEQLSTEEMLKVYDYLDYLYIHDKPIDVFLTHTCPCIYEPVDLFLPMVDQSLVDKSMERFLGRIEYEYPYKAWFWGHYHANREYPVQEDNVRRVMLIDEIIDFSAFIDHIINNGKKSVMDFSINKEGE